jgi:biopolymer transport protein ExbB
MLELVEKGGPVVSAIFAVSSLAWLLTIVSWWRFHQEFGEARRGRRAPDRPFSFVERILTIAKELSRVGRRRFRRALQPYIESEVVTLRGNLRLIATLAACAPLLGLLGTVLGMMSAFGTLRASATADLSALSDAISSALLTTQAGLVVALPIVLVHRMLSSRLRRRLALLESALKRFQHADGEGSPAWKT